MMYPVTRAATSRKIPTDATSMNQNRQLLKRGIVMEHFCVAGKQSFIPPKFPHMQAQVALLPLMNLAEPHTLLVPIGPPQGD